MLTCKTIFMKWNGLGSDAAKETKAQVIHLNVCPDDWVKGRLIRKIKLIRGILKPLDLVREKIQSLDSLERVTQFIDLISFFIIQ